MRGYATTQRAVVHDLLSYVTVSSSLFTRLRNKDVLHQLP